MEVTLHQVTLSDLFGYCSAKDVASRFEKAKKGAELLNISIKMPDISDRKDEDYVSYNFAEQEAVVIVTDEQLVTLNINTVGYAYKQTVKVNLNPAAVFEQVYDKNNVQLTADRAVNNYNNKCDVHMPGNLMASYNEVQLLEDCCSDALQESLTQGWRIIAACPQPDQRRPDYILGRFSPDFNYKSFSSASRGN